MNIQLLVALIIVIALSAIHVVVQETASAKVVEQPPSQGPKVEILSEAVMVRITYRQYPTPQCMFWVRQYPDTKAILYLVECPEEA